MPPSPHNTSIRRHRAATLSSYGLVIGLIAILAIAAVTQLGSDVEDLFVSVDNTLTDASDDLPSTENGNSEEEDNEPEPDPCDGSQTVGTQCADDSYYAGLNGDGVAFFIAPCDEGMTYDAQSGSCTGTRDELAWENPNSNSKKLDAADTHDGLANTDAILNNYTTNNPAALACRARGAEWYLPAYGEMEDLYQQFIQPGTPLGASFETQHGYWTSKDRNTSRATLINMTSSCCTEVGHYRDVLYYVRCARR